MEEIVRKNVSISKILQEFLDDNPDLSCSKMLQSKILEIMENRRLRFAETDKLKKHIIFLSNKLEEAGDKIHVLENKNKRV